jgi:hypothetical protein
MARSFLSLVLALVASFAMAASPHGASFAQSVGPGLEGTYAFVTTCDTEDNLRRFLEANNTVTDPERGPTAARDIFRLVESHCANRIRLHDRFTVLERKGPFVRFELIRDDKGRKEKIGDFWTPFSQIERFTQDGWRR